MAPVLGALALVVALPLLFVLLQAVFPYLPENSLRAPFTAFSTIWSDPELPELFFNTLKLGIGVAAACLLVALPLAILRGLTDLPLGKLWDVLFLIPFMIPPYIGAFAWMLTLQTNGYSTQLFGFELSSWLFSVAGMVAVMTLHLFPVVYFTLSRALMIIGQRLADAGRVSGASAAYAFLRITLPLCLPALAGGMLMAFALTIEEYGTPAALGRPADFPVLITRIDEKFAEWPIDLPGAAMLSLLLVLLAIAAFALQHWIATRRSVVSVSGKYGQAVRIPLGHWRWAAIGLFVAVAFLAVFLPVAAVLATAFSETLSGGLNRSNFGLRHFEAVLSNESGAIDALRNSLLLALAAALGAGALGALAAWITIRKQVPGRAWVDALSILPNALPGMVVAVGLILAWNRDWWPVTIYNTSAILVLAYICLMLPYPVRYVSAGLRQIGGSLEAAARVSGAGTWRTLIRIVLPLIAPHLLVAMLLVFAISSRELVASVMLAPAGTSTVSTFVFNQFVQGAPGTGMALSVLAIFTSTAIMVAVSRLYRMPGGQP